MNNAFIINVMLHPCIYFGILNHNMQIMRGKRACRSIELLGELSPLGELSKVYTLG